MAQTGHGSGLFGKGRNRVCAVVAAGTSREMKRQIRAGLKFTRTVELRLDWLQNDLERTRFLGWLKREKLSRVKLIATCRRIVGGGKLSGGPEAELHWLMQAREAGCEWCDLEMETFRELPDGFVREYAIPKQILLSIHDFEETPELPRRVRVSLRGQVDAVKIAVKANSFVDAAGLLNVSRRSRGLVAIPMGEIGLPARLLALREGSELAYAPVETPTAPGQVGLREFVELYRADALTRNAAVYGVIGNPIAHSLSPLLHNTGFAARKMNAVYLPFFVPDLGDFVAAIRAFDLRGFSVTIPHKETLLKHLADCDPLAAEIGAVNTVVVRSNGSLQGFNTDYVGVLRALQKKMQIAKSRILIFGAGGSARAAAFALARAGAAVSICSRREASARALARAVKGEVVPRRALRSQRFEAICNTTPVGMYPRDKVSPLSARELNCHLAMDLIYRPERTRLLELAAARGIATVSGVEMFLAQGFAQWELWTGARAPESVMRRAVQAKLRSERQA